MAKPIFSFMKSQSSSVKMINVKDVIVNKEQPRKIFQEDKLQELKESIKQNGLIQPIAVRKKLDKYEIIAGERRYRATCLLGHEKIACIVMSADDNKIMTLALIENIQRQNLNFFEEALSYKKILMDGLTQEELARSLGKSQSSVANKLRVLNLPEKAVEMILTYNLTERHARALLRIQDKDGVLETIEYVHNKNLNVAQTEKYIQTKFFAEKGKSNKKIFILKDIRVFINSINNAIDAMQNNGINANVKKREFDGYLEYTIKIENKPNPTKIPRKADIG